MKVSIVGHTSSPDELMIMSKSTRLTMNEALVDKVAKMTDEEKIIELEYMVNTIKSSWEFFDITFLVEGVSRAFTHQFVRNRQGSYAQQTMRILNMDGFEYTTGPSILTNPKAQIAYDNVMYAIDEGYKYLLSLGVKEEDARGILPTNIQTNIMAKFNLRTLSDMMASRASGRTQDEYRQVIDAMYDACVEKWPWVIPFLRDHKHHALKELESIIHDRYDGTDLLVPYIKLIDTIRNAK
jgi:flavin-dependent thymidylate synthase